MPANQTINLTFLPIIMTRIQHSLLSVLLFFVPILSFAQDDLLKELEDKNAGENKKELTIATFKSTRLSNLHTIEVSGKRTLDVRISHRFGEFNSGGDNLWGLDGPANIRLALEYSYDGRLMFGLGRSSFGKMFDGFAKYRILRQTIDDSMPVSLTGFASINFTDAKDPNAQANGFDKYEKTSSRFSYVYQLLAARKFNDKLSLQLGGHMVHYNLVDFVEEKNDMFAISFSGRYKISKRVAITGEYVLSLRQESEATEDLYHNSASIGMDIETGGHVFQFMVSNSFAMNEAQFIPYTTTSWGDGGIRLGFNILRVFKL